VAPNFSRPIVKLLILMGVLLCASCRFVQPSSEEGAAPDLNRAIAKQRSAGIAGGFLVKDVPGLSTARQVGIRAGDIVVSYDGKPVSDMAQYHAARSAAAGKGSVELELMREGKSLKISVPPILLGFTGSDWAPLRDEIIAKLKQGHADMARKLLDSSEAEHTISAKHATALRITLLGREKPIDEPARARLLEQVASNLKADEIFDLGDLYKELDDFVPAAFMYEKGLALDPHDLSAGPDLARVYFFLNRYDEAEQLADSFISRPDLPLSDYGWFQAFRTKARVAYVRKKYDDAVSFYRKAMSWQPDLDDFTIQMEYLLAAAWSGNLEQFEQAVRVCDSRGGELYPQRPYYVDSLRAFVLVRGNRLDQARQIAQKWRENVDANRRIQTYWTVSPDQDAIRENWTRLNEK
jgi:tetratricopeptide (TPR) repeat protein